MADYFKQQTRLGVVLKIDEDYTALGLYDIREALVGEPSKTSFFETDFLSACGFRKEEGEIIMLEYRSAAWERTATGNVDVMVIPTGKFIESEGSLKELIESLDMEKIREKFPTPI